MSIKWFKTAREYNPDKDLRKSPLVIDFSAAKVKKEDFADPKQNALDAVKKITSTYPPPYSLMASGGLDSQAMIHCWLMSGVEFKIYHITYDDFNNEDTSSLYEFVEKNQIENLLTVQNFDVIGFINSNEYKDYAKKYDCVSPQILTYMKMSESIPGTVILSGNFITQDTPGINYTILGLDRYRQRSNRNIVPFFFLSTDLLAYSFFYSYKKFEKYSYESNVYHHGHFVKKKCYQLLGANLAVPRKKLTGFEKIKEHFDTIHVPKLKLKYSKMGSARPFDLIYRYSLFEDIGFYSEEARIIHPGNLNPTIKKS